MPIVVVTAGASSVPSSGATTLAQSIMDCAAQDMRQMLSSSAGDVGTQILLDYVDRVHREICERKRWKFLQSDIKTFTTVAGQSNYFIGIGSVPSGATDTGLALNDVRSINPAYVVDRTNGRQLFHTDEQPISIDQYWTLNNYPTVWRNDTSNLGTVVNLYPPPQGVYTIEFRYFKVINAITTVGQTIQIPDDYKHVMCAGVNYYLSAYLKRQDDILFWQAAYSEGLQRMIRDSNLFPRIDFISPGN